MSVEHERIPFHAVISSDKLMKSVWEELSIPQQVAVKAFYGLPLSSEAELKAWSVFKGGAIFDELGYPVEWNEIPYHPMEYSTIVGLLGRRSGKSDRITGTIVLYEILFGGHTKHVEKGQTVIVPYLSLDLPTAKENLYFIYLMAQKVPALAKRIEEGSGRNYIKFKNGITVQPEPPVIKTGRGIAMPIVIMDEVGFWYKTAENANPDVEVQRAVAYSQAQFPDRKQIIISTPYTEEGMLYDYSMRDEQELRRRRTLFINAPTAAMENPRIDRQFLAEEQEKDPQAFIRECLARFVTSIDGYIDPILVSLAMHDQPDIRIKADVEKNGLKPYYVAVMDPAFRNDDFAFTIGHRDNAGRVVQDLLKVWTPPPKGTGVLDPGQVIDEIAQICKEWGVNLIYSDQYQLESLKHIFLNKRISVVGIDFTSKSKAKIYGSLTQLLKAKNISLLNSKKTYQQLTQLQRKLGAMGNVQISAPPGKHDDVATVTALLANQCLQHYPSVSQAKPKEKSIFEEGIECIRRKMATVSREESLEGLLLPR